MKPDVQSSTSQIFFTPDYSKFSFVKGNRDISEKKINKILTSIENGLNLLPYCPIIVDKDYNIIDGQHRFYVSKKIKSPVFYVMSKEITLMQIAEMNSNTDKWKTTDFLNCYIDLGNEHYKELREFMSTYKLSLSSAMYLLGGDLVKDHGFANDDFKHGLFKVTNRIYGEEIMQLAVELHDKGVVLSYNKRAFLSALCKLINSDVYDQEYLIDKSKKSGKIIENFSEVKDYLRNFEDIYNYNNTKRIVLF